MGTAWVRHGHGMDTAWARPAMCKSAFILAYGGPPVLTILEEES
jgi:hypothetical protein